VVLDTTRTDTSRSEGLARSVARQVQALRKKLNLSPADKIAVWLIAVNKTDKVASGVIAELLAPGDLQRELRAKSNCIQLAAETMPQTHCFAIVDGCTVEDTVKLEGSLVCVRIALLL
jgi:hypothetical protein